MPNWCYNNMTVRGNTDDLRKFVKAISVSETNEATGNTYSVLRLSSLYPIPAELMEYTAPLSRKDENGNMIPLTDDEREELLARFRVHYGATDWYDWCVSHWGTKWGDHETTINSGTDSEDNVEDGATLLSIYYETAWSPADGLIAKISEMYPNLLFSVVSTEEADLFACWSVFHKGEIVGNGSVDTDADLPEEIAVLQEKEETMDEFYEAYNEWQCERNSVLDDKESEFVDKYLSDMKARRNAVERDYKLRMILLKEEMDKALSEFSLSEVVGANN